MIKDTNDFRWLNYFIRDSTKFEDFWTRYLKNNKRILFVMGSGFDPRMCYGIKKILSSNFNSNFCCKVIDYKEGSASPSKKHSDKKTKNIEELYKICEGKCRIETMTLKLRNSSDEINLRNSTKIFSSIKEFEGFTDIIVDISAMPLSVYFPLLAKILNILDKSKNGGPNLNLHVVAAENVTVDECILEMEIEDEAMMVFPFMANIETEELENVPKIWLPIIGEHQSDQIDKINTMLKPDEIAPILPSVSSKPRRGDDIYLRYRDIFTQLQIEPKNIIHGAEQNPFEVYRELLSAIIRYRKSLESLGRCKIAISTLSSKLLSMAAFLCAYEGKSNNMDIGVAHVFSKGFTMQDGCIKDPESTTTLFTMWIYGDCYDP